MMYIMLFPSTSRWKNPPTRPSKSAYDRYQPAVNASFPTPGFFIAGLDSPGVARGFPFPFIVIVQYFHPSAVRCARKQAEGCVLAGHIRCSPIQSHPISSKRLIFHATLCATIATANR